MNLLHTQIRFSFVILIRKFKKYLHNSQLTLYLSTQPVRFNKRTCKGKVVSVYCGAYHTFLKTDIGTCFVFGLNNYGQCGTGSLEDYYCPIPFKWDSTASISQIAGGLHHTLILDTNGDVHSFGRAHYGRLGWLYEDDNIFNH